MNSRQIEIFYTVMKAGSVTEAAARLNITQPAVTASLKQIETSLGFNLFHRAGGRLHPTAEAHVLLAEAARLHDSVTVFKKLAGRLKKDLTTHLRVAAPPSFCHTLVPDTIADFTESEADSMIDVTTQHHEGILNDLSGAAGHNNLGITFGLDDRTDIGSHLLGKADIVAVVPDRLSLPPSERLDISSLQHVPMIGTFPGEPLGNTVEGLIAPAGFTPHYKARVHSHAVAGNLAAKGVGVAIIDSITAHFIKTIRPHDDIRLVPLANAPRLPITAVYSYEHPLNKKAHDFLEIFRRKLRALQNQP